MTSDERKYTDTGLRGPDAREGFGDDMGTRVGRPDGESDASSARPAPRDASRSTTPGQASTNAGPVGDGLEGSIMDDGDDASDADVNPPRESGDDRPTFNL